MSSTANSDPSPTAIPIADTLQTTSRGDDVLHALPVAVVLLDCTGTIVFANHAAQRMHGSAIAGSTFLALVEPAERMVVDGYLQSLRANLQTGESRYMTCRLQVVDGQPLHIAAVAAPLLLGGSTGFLLNLTDITSQRERDAQLQLMALTDVLTGLPNRRSFLHSIRAAISAGEGCVLAIADIDRFKLVNDQFGHDFGDRVIGMVASRMVESLPSDAVIARMGGDEFAVLIPGAIDDSSLRQLESLRTIEVPADLKVSGLQTVSLSIGVTHTTAGDEAAMLRQSDIAMYAAKASGRARVAVFGPDSAALLEHSQSLASLVENLRQQNERLHSEARTDARTGLANSRALAELEGTVIGAGGSSWPECGVLFVDIDHFGAFNHLYGDDAGDVALRHFADAMRGAVRKDDLVFRKGGEEFVMVLPMATQDAVERVAEQLAERIAGLRIPHAEGPTGWLSALIVGVSALPQETVGDAIVRAGNAAMRCKATGVRAQVVLAT